MVVMPTSRGGHDVGQPLPPGVVQVDARRAARGPPQPVCASPRRRTWPGLPYPVVSRKPHFISAQGDGPLRHLHNAVLRHGPFQGAAEGGGQRDFKGGRAAAGCAATAAATAAISSNICAWDFLTLAKLWVSLTDKGIEMWCAPSASAACAPRRFGTRTATFNPGSVLANRTSSAVSASCGSRRAGTKEPTSISGAPAAASAAIQAFLASVGRIVPMFCRPSRGPTSLTVTSMAADMLDPRTLNDLMIYHRDKFAAVELFRDSHHRPRGHSPRPARGAPATGAAP